MRKIYVIMCTICVLLTYGICIQLKTTRNTGTGLGKTQTENELRDAVLRWKEKYDDLYNEEEEQTQKLEKLRTEIATVDTGFLDVKEEITRTTTLLGYTEVEGEGIIITVQDATGTAILSNATDYVVHDGDLLEIVNALKNAGAEAISINGQRIVNSTAITCAGNIIKINGEKQGSPFEIKAIGLTAKLYGALTMPGGYLELLETDGVQVKVEKSSNIVIPKYTGTYKFQYAENIEK